MAGERQVAIVTGGASGIGRAMSLGLLEGGIDVAAVDREAAWLDELKAAASGRRFSGALQAIQAGSRKDDGIRLALTELPQSCIDVAAKFNVFQIRPRVTQLRLAAHDPPLPYQCSRRMN